MKEKSLKQVARSQPTDAHHFFEPPMNPAFLPSKPARSTFLSALAFFLSTLALERAWRLALRLESRCCACCVYVSVCRHVSLCVERQHRKSESKAGGGHWRTVRAIEEKQSAFPLTCSGSSLAAPPGRLFCPATLCCACPCAWPVRWACKREYVSGCLLCMSVKRLTIIPCTHDEGCHKAHTV